MESRSFYQQGDVIIEVIDEIIEREKCKERKSRIIAEGEATGHKHVIIGEEARLLVRYNYMYIDAPKGGIVKHDKHAPIVIPPGKYSVRMVREFDHLSNMTREVRD